MDLQIEGRHFKVTEPIQNHLKDKLGKLEKYFDGIHRMRVILEVEKNLDQTVQLACTVAKRHTLIATGSADDLYAAIDIAEKKMLAEMKKYKAKLRSVDRKNKSLAAFGAPAAVEREGAEEEDE